jgi:nucleoside-diphosphate-sugar epimerase
MRALVIGGTGLISTGIVKHLLARGTEVTVFNRGARESTISPKVKQLHGDRNDNNALTAAGTFDAVIDMVCFHPDQAKKAIDVFAGRCGHFIFCSTVCTYGVKVPSAVLVDESFPQEPISEYGRNKLACEKMLLDAHAAKKMNVTIIRPSSTYGPGGGLIDNLEFDPVAWDRIERGLPVLCGGDGVGLWVSTHRDDCGKLFAYAAGNPTTFGQSYNATRDRQFTWRDLYRESASVLGKPARLLFMPAAWIVKHDPQRFGLLREISQFHGAYTSAKAKRDVPEFVCEIDYPTGAAETIADIRRRGKWRKSEGDSVYQKMVDQALSLGVEPIEA